MFCHTCGTQVRDGDAYCSKCGAKVHREENGLNQDVFVDDNAFSAAKKAPVKTYNADPDALSSCKQWMVTGLIFNIINAIPYINVLTMIPTVILSVLSMNRAIGFLSGIQDEEAQKLCSRTSLVRTHYIACIVVSLIILILSIFVIFAASSGIVYRAEVRLAGLLVIAAVVGILDVFYFYGIHIWALVHWIMLNDFMTKVTAGIKK